MDVPSAMVDRIRQACLSLPEAQERLSHGAPTFFVRGKVAFVTVFADGHHGNVFPHLWCAAPDGVQSDIVESRPQQFFRPPYVGHRGWLGVRLDRGVGDEELADLCEEAYRVVAPATLVRQLDTVDRAEQLMTPDDPGSDA